MYTVDNAFSTALPSVDAGIVNAPPAHLRWTNTTAEPYQWSFMLKGESFGASDND